MAARIADGGQVRLRRGDGSMDRRDLRGGDLSVVRRERLRRGRDRGRLALPGPGRLQVYEPGSVFKMFTVLAALEHEHDDARRRSTATPAGCGSTAARRGSPTPTTARWATCRSRTPSPTPATSSRPRSPSASRPTRTEASTILHEVWTRLGFGATTGIDVAGEVRGLVNDPATTAWREIDLANGSFGQGVAVTQIQLAAAYAALVNGGVLVQPHVVAGLGAQQVSLANDAPVFDPKPEPAASPASWSTCSRTRGTSTRRRCRATWIGGKTGHGPGLGFRQHGAGCPTLYNFSFVGLHRPHRRATRT